MIKWFSSFTPKNLCRTLLPVFVAFLIGSTLASCLLHRGVQLGAGHLGVLPQVDSVVLGVVDGGALVVEVHLKVVHSLLRVGSEVLHTSNQLQQQLNDENPSQHWQEASSSSQLDGQTLTEALLGSMGPVRHCWKSGLWITHKPASVFLSKRVNLQIPRV